ALFSALFTLFFSFNPPPPSQTYTLSLHDALPISCDCNRRPFVTQWRRVQAWPRLAPLIGRDRYCSPRRYTCRVWEMRPPGPASRSEERRVGKEWRGGGSA